MTREDALNKIKELENYIKELDTVGYKDDPIFLLSAEEYEKYKDVIPHKNVWWWLRSPGRFKNYIMYVYADTFMRASGVYGYYSDGAIRPAIKFRFNFKVGDTFMWHNVKWIVIDNNLAISVMPIEFDKFDNESNDYENSYIRKWLLDWYNTFDYETIKETMNYHKGIYI